MKNKYLEENRLADVIAAITALSTYKFYKLDFEKWSHRIAGVSEDPKHWETVFREHPEFFRINSGDGKASLVWRRQYPRTYDVDKGEDIKLLPTQKYTDGDRFSRRPLNPSEITALISVAVSMHDRALEQRKAKKWWIPIATAVLALLGAIIGGYFAGNGVGLEYLGKSNGT